MSSVLVGTGVMVASGANSLGAALATASAGTATTLSGLGIGITSAILSNTAPTSHVPTPSGSSGGKNGHPQMSAEEEDWQAAQSTKFSHWLFVSLACATTILLLYRMFIIAGAHIRHIVCIPDSQQRYWSRPLSPLFAKFKKDFIYAPFLRRRHNREFRISAATNVGTLPTRFQSLFLTALLAGNITLCVFSIDWKEDRSIVLSQLRNRTGILSVINMVPLFVLVGRNNPLIQWLRISFDTYNLIHRWLGRIVIIEAIAHSVAHIANRGTSAFVKSLSLSTLIMIGFVSTCAMSALLIQSPSIFRHAFYETFLGVHIALAIVATATLYYHLALAQVDWILYLQIAIGFWVGERLYRFVNIFYRNCGRSTTKATITALSVDACRVTLDMPRPWKFKPGQHIYLYLPGMALFQNHPFSVAWSEEEDEMVWDGKGDLPMSRKNVYGPKKTSMELIVRRRTGITNSLYKKADTAPGRTITMRAFVEGPYGAVENLHSYGTVVMFAGGIGITHHLPHVRDLVQGYADGTVATRKITLIWVLQHPEHLQWVKKQMTKILAMEKRRECLKIILFITRPKTSKDIMSPSSTVMMFSGKPNCEELLAVEVEQRIGSMAVSVCGPGGLSDDVRRAARSNIDNANIDFIEEAFSR